MNHRSRPKHSRTPLSLWTRVLWFFAAGLFVAFLVQAFVQSKLF